MKLQGKRIVITGASSGIGRALAVALAREGCVLTLAGRDAARLRFVAMEAAGREGLRPRVVAADLSLPSEVRRLVREAAEGMGGIDIFVNNAGISVYGETERTTEGDVRRVMEVDFFAPFQAMLAAVPLLREAGGGVLVNVASVAAIHGVPYLGAYGAAKAALVAASHSLRAELAETGIRVLVVYPDYTRTPLFGRETRLGGARRPAAGYASPDHVAREIVCALEDERDELVLSLRARLMAFASGLFPRLADRVMASLAERLRIREEVEVHV